jgi:hypothetical protein
MTVFRYRRLCWHVGLVGLVLFGLMTGAGIALSLSNADGSFRHPVLFAIVSGCVFGSCWMLSLYLLIAYRRARLGVSKATIRHDGVFRSKTMPFAEVTRAVWRGWPRGGSLVLYSSCDRLVVHFGNYANAVELAERLRATLPAEVQERYQRFESACVAASAAFNRRRYREQWFFIGSLPVLGVAVAVLVLWDPHGIRQWCAAPIAFMIVMGLQALFPRWRAGGIGASETGRT